MSTLPSVLSETEYFSIEEAICATAKGRAFLRQRDKIGRAVGVDAIGQLVNGLKDWIAGDYTGTDHGPATDHGSLELIRRELGAVRTHIEQVKSEISTLANEEQSPNRFRRATAELYEIVTSTARATDDILSAAETIKQIVDALPAEHAAQRETVGKHCLDIFQACSFQDITGQRIAKVVKTLEYVEERVNAMLAIGDTQDDVDHVAPPVPQQPAAAPVRAEEPDSLLNGPQLPGMGLNQDAIDQLLTGAAAAQPVPPPQPAMPAAPAPAQPAMAATPAKPATSAKPATPAASAPAQPAMAATPAKPAIPAKPAMVAAMAAVAAVNSEPLAQNAIDSLFA